MYRVGQKLKSKTTGQEIEIALVQEKGCGIKFGKEPQLHLFYSFKEMDAYFEPIIPVRDTNLIEWIDALR